MSTCQRPLPSTRRPCSTICKVDGRQVHRALKLGALVLFRLRQQRIDRLRQFVERLTRQARGPRRAATNADSLALALPVGITEHLGVKFVQECRFRSTFL